MQVKLDNDVCCKISPQQEHLFILLLFFKLKIFFFGKGLIDSFNTAVVFLYVFKTKPSNLNHIYQRAAASQTFLHRS